MAYIETSPPKISRLLFSDTRLEWLWLIVRLYLGYEWITAGWSKLTNPEWSGWHAGAALKEFLEGALAKTGGQYPDVQAWYAVFIKDIALQHLTIFSYLVAYGEFLVGLGLILGALTGVAAFFGAFMNLNYLLAGTVSINPQMLVLAVFLALAWRTAGRIGLDRWIKPVFSLAIKKAKST